MKTDFMFGITTGYVIYDIETFPNAFTLRALHCDTMKRWKFEISTRRNDIDNVCLFLNILSDYGCSMVGFNNIGFDYPVLHFIHRNHYTGITVLDIYNKAMAIIGADHNQKFAHMVWENDWIVDQVDLYKVHHFDNMSKATSLKVLEFNMRMNRIEDLPFDVGTILTDEQIDVLHDYNDDDVNATKLFFDYSQSELKMRCKLSVEFDTNMMNMSDVKIGETILIHEMDKKGINCYEYIDNKKTKKQTIRESIDLRDVIFNYVKFERVEFQNIQSYLEARVITETKGVFNGLIASIDGVDYKFGTGGLHASVESQVVYSTNTHQLVDVDVASFYPNLGIKNKLYPAHLGQQFCDAYEGVYHTRKQYAKGSAENGAYKLALNGAYGNSNNAYSSFFDSLYTMSITINGQLLLCMLIEQMLKIPDLRMIQANTDGITYLCPKEYLDHSRNICRWWEQVTKLELEEVLYNRMFIRDVNNYMAEKEDGKIKRIGAYAYVNALEDNGTRELPWHKNWSSRVVAMAAEQALVYGEDIRDFIYNHPEMYDFFLKTKVPRSSILEHGGERVPNIIRYYISKDGKPLEKVSPPAGMLGEFKRANKLTDEYFNSVIDEVGYGVWDARIHTKNKSQYSERRMGINTGWSVTICNNLDDLLLPPDGGDWLNSINYDWYVQEAEKLVKPLLK